MKNKKLKLESICCDEKAIAIISIIIFINATFTCIIFFIKIYSFTSKISTIFTISSAIIKLIPTWPLRVWNYNIIEEDLSEIKEYVWAAIVNTWHTPSYIYYKIIFIIITHLPIKSHIKSREKIYYIIQLKISKVIARLKNLLILTIVILLSNLFSCWVYKDI